MYVEFIIFKNPKKEFEVPTLQEKKKKGIQAIRY